jgi:hypothetical protein
MTFPQTTINAAPAPLRPDAAALGRWLHSWVQPDGAIHGFHNHAVWGGNPFHVGDFTAGHSTFASPLLPGLAHALQERPDARGQELLEQLLAFQSVSFQADGQFEHIGFQVGETLKRGLIHSVVPDAALSETALLLGDRLRPTLRDKIDGAVRRNLAACDRLYGPGAHDGSVANQEYCRQWARLLHMEAFQHRTWDDAVLRDLAFLIASLHVRGLPDEQSAGALRVKSDANLIEPAEYYGLMIHPLAPAARRYGEAKYFDAALGLARHVVRSSWADGHGQRRLHRLWQRVDGQWIKIDEPMLIGGMGLTLSAIEALHRLSPDAELARFVTEMDRTYAHYQSPAGFFLAASGWGGEQDIIPSSAWQSHDFYHLLARHGASEEFWDTLFAPDSRVAVVFGQSLMWMETGPHWKLGGYHTAHGLELAGRKDRMRFGIDVPAWIGSGREMPPEYQMPAQPAFLRTDTGIRHLSGRTDIAALSATQRPYIAPAKE